MYRHTINLYTPVLSENVVTRFLPPRWNEVLSVYHMKSYIFDNNMIISGANLSNDYFTSRIDRYVLFEDCPELIQFYEDFFSILSRYCSTVSSQTGTINHFRTSHTSSSSQDLAAPLIRSFPTTFNSFFIPVAAPLSPTPMPMC